jgi:hypothetical protein
MNYLTNYYKNLSEQLQEQVNNLEQLLEYRKKGTTYFDVLDINPYSGDKTAPLVVGTEVTKKGNPRGKGAKKTETFSFYPGMGAITNMGSNQEELAWGALGAEVYRRGDGGDNPGHFTRTIHTNNPIYNSFRGMGPPLEVRSDQLFKDTSDMRQKGGSVRGTGKKAKKKALAIAAAKAKSLLRGTGWPNDYSEIEDGPQPY